MFYGFHGIYEYEREQGQKFFVDVALVTKDNRTAEELRAALADALTQPLPVLYDIKVLPKSMTDGYESWWRVGVAEVSEQPRVRQAYEDLQAHLTRTRDY